MPGIGTNELATRIVRGKTAFLARRPNVFDAVYRYTVTCYKNTSRNTYKNSNNISKGCIKKVLIGIHWYLSVV